MMMTPKEDSHYDLEIVTGNHFLAILHPANTGLWVSRHGTLELDVSGLVSVSVGRVVQELRRNCGRTRVRVRNTFGSVEEVTVVQRAVGAAWTGANQSKPSLRA